MSDTPAIAGFKVVSQDAWEAALAACEEYRFKLDELERENAALRADRDRLDSGTIVLPVRGEPVCFVGTDLRAAIDAGMRKAQP